MWFALKVSQGLQWVQALLEEIVYSRVADQGEHSGSSNVGEDRANWTEGLKNSLSL